MKIISLVVVFVLLVTAAMAQEIEVEVGEDIYIDAFGWQPSKSAFDMMPWAGGAFVLFGILNIHQEHKLPGWMQIIVGTGMIIASIFID